MIGIFQKIIDVRSRFSRYTTIIGFLSIYCLVLLLLGYLQWQRLEKYGHTRPSTNALYYRVSLNLIQGQMPYRDFAFEYPPLALLPIILPHLIKLGRVVNPSDYAWLFMLENVLMSMLLGLTIMRIASYFQPWPHCLRVLAVYSLLSMIIAPLLLGRYDLFPTLLMGVAVMEAIGGHPTRSGVWLGLGVAAKLFPIVLLPILSIYYLVSRNYRSLLGVFVGVTVSVGLTLLPFLPIGMDQLLSFLRYHQLRGLQIESVLAGIALAAHVLIFSPVTVEYNFGALHITSSIADTVLPWLPTLSILTFAVVFITLINCFRCEFEENGVITNEHLLLSLLSALLTFIVTSKVFSPQYISWLLPLASFLRLRQIILVAVVFAMTIVIYPFMYDRLVALQTLPIVLLNVRNFLTVVLLVWLVYSTVTGHQKKHFCVYREA